MSIGIVQTQYGKVRGIEQTEGKYAGVSLFLGVPYAKAPVGDLRWKPPVDHDGWDGVLDCMANKPAAVQKRIAGLAFEPYASDFYYMGNPPVSEDCLYLNIATGAASADEKRPVFVWFHGGGLADGFAYEVEFDPNEFARKGIIVVSVAQRLNILGYLALPQLSAEQGGKSGNYGFMDEVKALDWVRENIAAFGGNPDNITIGGQSGGVMKSGTLAASPYGKGKVKRVINQSTLNWRRKVSTLDEAYEYCRNYLEFMGFNPDASLEELRAIPAMDLIVDPYLKDAPRAPSMMICDGDYVPNISIAKSVEEYCGDVDYLYGGNYGENAMSGKFFIGVQEPETLDFILDVAKKELGDLYDKYDFEKISGLTEENSDVLSRWYASMGITAINGVAEYTKFGALRAERHPNARNFCYIFDRVAPCHPEEIGGIRDSKRLLSWHSSEMWYTFNSLRENVPPARPWEKTDFELAETMNNYWVNFIKTGDPNGEGLPVWPEARENLGWMELGDKPVGHEGIEGKMGELILENYNRKFVEE